MTERLYYQDSHIREFDANVLDCRQDGSRWAVVLDRTAFFPEGGGQCGDAGTLNGIPVTDTREISGEILHFCSEPLPAGSAVHGSLDWADRFLRMQCHSAEHIISGIAHTLWSCENVGFHVAEDSVTIDLDRELSETQLNELVHRANAAVWDNRSITAVFPSAQELSAMSYRQKKTLEGDIRIVTVEGIDTCACCAPHCKRTGEIGLILLTDAMRHRGGVRLTMVAGSLALQTALAQGSVCAELSRLFSVPRFAAADAARRQNEELERLKLQYADRERAYAASRLDSAAETDGVLLFFEAEDLSPAAMRLLAEGGAKKAGVLCGVFAGSDASGWKYVLSSCRVDLRRNASALNALLQGRGGGRPEMIQGSAALSRAEIEERLVDWHG